MVKDKKSEKSIKDKLKKNWVFYVLLICIGLLSIFTSPKSDTPEEVVFSEALTMIKEEPIEKITLNQGSYTMVLENSEGDTFISPYSRGWEENLVDLIQDKELELVIKNVNPNNPLFTLLVSLLPILIIVGLILWMMGGLTKGDSKTKSDKPDTRLSDVAGVEEAIEEVTEIVEYLKDPKPYERLTAKPPNGVLLVGPPGTGKTLLARAIAGESDVPFYHTTGASFVEMFAGVGPKRVKSLFKEAKKNKKAIIFIDEIDAIGRERNSGRSDSVTREMDSTLTTLLTEIDGFEQNNIIVIGATNLPDSIDPALQRRLHKIVEVPLPDSGGREKILKLHAKDRPFEENINWANISKQTIGFSGAQLSLVVDGACLIATRREAVKVSENDLIEAAVNINVGKERKSAVITDFDKQVTAWHEAGHTIVGHKLENALKPNYVTIIPRGESGGHTRFTNEENNFYTKSMLIDQLAAVMGGRAAEIIFLGEDNYTQGAGGDIQAGTQMAFEFVTKYGMGSRLSAVNQESLQLGADLAAIIDKEVEKLLQEALKTALNVLKENKTLLETLKNELIEKETLSEDELYEVLNADYS